MNEAEKLLNFAFFAETDPEVHTHRDPELIYLPEGTGGLWIAGEEFDLSEESVMLVGAETPHRLMLSEHAVAAGIRIPLNKLTMLLKCRNPEFETDLNGDVEIRRILSQLVNHSLDHTTTSDVLRTGLSYQLIYRLSLHERKNGDAVRGSEKEKRKEILSDYLEAHYREPVSLETLADVVHVSTGYLSKFFKREFGNGYQEYLTSVRLMHCAEDILEGKKTMLENALTNGFQSLSSFNKAFRRQYGMSPTQYRSSVSEADHAKEENAPEGNPEVIREYLKKAETAETKAYSEAIRITADTLLRRELTKHWNQVINVGPVELLLRSDLQNQLMILKDQLGFRYARVWNIFQSMLQNEERENGELNYARLDRAIDFLLKIGMKPYMDMEFKPFRVSDAAYMKFNPAETDAEKKLTAQFALQIRKLCNHFANRYGAKEMESWYFEFGKSETEISAIGFPAYMKQYRELYETAYRTLKNISENIRIGGWGFFGVINLKRDREVIRYWKENNCLPDQLTLLLFPYEMKDENASAYTCSTDPEYMRTSLTKLQDLFISEGIGDIPIHVTEWNNTISQRSILNDSCFKGAFLVKNLIESFDGAELTAYWSISDLYGESYDTKGILHGGCGLISVDGIYKPAYYGLEFMNRLQNFVMKKSGNSILTTNGKGHITILSHNMKGYSYRFYHSSEDNLGSEEAMFDNQESERIEYTIRNVQNGDYRVKIRYMNRENGSVRDEWKRLGGGSITVNECDYLKAVSRPKLQIRVQKVEKGELHLETVLEPNEIQLIDISYMYQE